MVKISDKYKKTDFRGYLEVGLDRRGRGGRVTVGKVGLSIASCLRFENY